MSETAYTPPKNPVIKTIFSADPEAKVWESEPDKLYLYPSRDRYPSAGCDHMDQYHVFSTTNMIDFVDEGEILRRADLHDLWAPPGEIHPETEMEKTFMWAPDVAYRNGYYYYYWPTPRHACNRPEGSPLDTPSWNNTWETGVIRSKHPHKDFEQIPVEDAYPDFKGYIEGIGYAGIDAAVRVYEDQAYIYLGGGGQFYQGKLKSNMVEMDGPLIKMTENHANKPVGGISYALPDYHEGPSMFCRKNDAGELIYYLVHPGYEHANHKEGEPYGGDSFRYSMGSTPLGNPLAEPITEIADEGLPHERTQIREHVWDYKGAFFAPTGCDTSHGSVVEFKNKYYFVYHTADLSGHGTQRSVCIEEFNFNPDGSIIPFAKSNDGVRQNGPDYVRPKGTIYTVPTDYQAGDDVTFENVDGGNGVRAMIVFSYATPDDLPKMELLVNGVSYSYLNFVKTGGHHFFAEAAFTPKALNSGATNTIKLQRSHADTQGTITLKSVEVVLFDE